MTSKPPTALEEIQGRVELLGKQIESAKEDAKTSRNLADGHENRVAELAKLRDEYLAVLKPSPFAVIASHTPEQIAEMAARGAKWGLSR